MSRRRTSSAPGKPVGDANVARVKRLRWWLLLGVLIVAFDFARVSVNTLSPEGQSAQAAAAVPIRPGDGAPPHSATDTEVASRRNASSGPSRARAPSSADRAAGIADTVTLEEARDARYVHLALWPGQIAVNHGPGAWRWLSQLPRRWDDALSAAWTPREANDRAIEAVSREPPSSLPERTPSVAHQARSSSPQPRQLVLRNATTSSRDVHFLVNERPFSLSPGERLGLTGHRWLVRFHRGGEFGDAAYTIWPGSYEFSVNSGGWDLVRKWRY